MGCGASKVDPVIQKNEQQPKERPTSTSSAPEINNNKKKPSEIDTHLARAKVLPGQLASSSSTPNLVQTPKKSLLRDSNGSIKVASCSVSSVKSDGRNNPLPAIAKKDSTLSARADLFAAKPPTPPLAPLGDHPLKLKPLSFVVPLDKSGKEAVALPRRLESLSNPPKILSEKELQEKMRLKEEKRQLELERKKLKSSRMSRRKRELIAAQEQSKIHEQAEEIKNKMETTDQKRERRQAEIIEKQRKHKEHAQKVRERARRIKAGEDVDEGLGGEMETYKSNSDDGGNDSWLADDDEQTTNQTRELVDKPSSSRSKTSHASLDTLDSGVAKLSNDVDEFYNA